MTTHDPHCFPHHLDDPFKFILWTLDEWTVMALPLLLSLMCHAPLPVGFLLSVVSLIALKRFKGEQGHFYLIYTLYWYLPPVFRFKVIPPSYQRDWIG